MDGYQDPTKPGKRRLKRHKKPTRAQLEHKLAAWQDKLATHRADYRELVMRWHRWWVQLTPQEQAERVQEYRSRPARRYAASIFDPDHPHPHPDSERGRQIIEESYLVRDARREIEKVEKQLAALG